MIVLSMPSGNVSLEVIYYHSYGVFCIFVFAASYVLSSSMLERKKSLFSCFCPVEKRKSEQSANKVTVVHQKAD